MPLRIATLAYTHYASDPRVRREAEAFAGRGDAVTVWSLGSPGTPDRENIRGVEVRTIDLPRYRGRAAAAYARSYLRFMAAANARILKQHLQDPFDIVHVHTMPDFLVFAGLIPRLSGAKVVLDMHDLMPELFAVKFGLKPKGWASQALRAVQWSATTFADHVISVHQNQYEILLRKGVPARKLGVVMNVADPELFPRRKKLPRMKADGPIRVVYHGTLLARYGIDVALRAFALARKQEPRLQLRIFGGGDAYEGLRQRAGELGLTEPVLTMTGTHQPLDAVAQAIRDAHIGLVPGRDTHEDSVLPTKMLEYLAVGVPTVASRTRTVGRFFDETHAELVPPDDPDAMAAAILRLASDAARAKALVQGGFQWQEAYGWDVNRSMLFRTMDALCFEKLQRERKTAVRNTGDRAPQPSK